MERIKVASTIPTSPQKLYEAWLSSKKHSDFTGGEAKINPKLGGKMSAWDGYITGKFIQFNANTKIVQTWRSSNFPEASEDSLLTIIFDKVDNGTKITLVHTNIPDGQGEIYKKGWKDFYFAPMKKYFGKSMR
jgi:activator of HSP90 ATPase